MCWRIVATRETVVQTDFVWALGTIGLISFLELWLGFIVACTPTLVPLLRKYPGHALSKLYPYHTKRRDAQLHEAQNSIGGGTRRGLRRPYDQIEEDQGAELLQSSAWQGNATTVTSYPPLVEDAEEDPGSIHVKHHFHVTSS